MIFRRWMYETRITKLNLLFYYKFKYLFIQHLNHQFMFKRNYKNKKNIIK